MERLRKLEEMQRMMILMESHGILTNSSDHDSTRFVANLIFFLAINNTLLKRLCSLTLSTSQIQICLKLILDKWLWLGWMRCNDQILRLKILSYFMFHGLDSTQPQQIFRYLPVLSFTESYIYQLDSLNEKMLNSTSYEVAFSERGSKDADMRLISMFHNVFKNDPFRPLAGVLEFHGLLTKRIEQQFKCGEEYWALERGLCSAIIDRKEIHVEDVIKAIHLKSFDYRVLNLLLYQLRGEQVNELHMDFLSVSEFLVEVADDLFDYEDDVVENNFNILRMFVRIYGASAPTMLAKHITEAEEKYNAMLKTLDSQLSLNYQRRCEEATKEGGNKSGHPLGTWSIPPLILDEELYRSNLLDPK
ncbi:uncharacterized protein LOC107425315 isoform X4 [Ziziphus jujuba]|uniref:Uncharacterized protein LOC107425315 isoform X4 n=1 Tax=Ziziphus jujuba TaxID=326968 RepID=A0A6P4AXI3_ZIZJJ|nr:uncharacterized protein LOC107425315 isoform X4 [Ziziphus jujuba]